VKLCVIVRTLKVTYHPQLKVIFVGVLKFMGVTLGHYKCYSEYGWLLRFIQKQKREKLPGNSSRISLAMQAYFKQPYSPKEVELFTNVMTV